MREAQQGASTLATARRKNGRNLANTVYTSDAGSAAPNDPTADSASQDSLNATV
jgi:hypothetical protein